MMPAEGGGTIKVALLLEDTVSTEDTKHFRSATGALLYVSRCTRPDVTDAVVVRTTTMSKPGPKASVTLTRAMRYLKKAIDFEIRYHSDIDFGGGLVARYM